MFDEIPLWPIKSHPIAHKLNVNEFDQCLYTYSRHEQLFFFVRHYFWRQSISTTKYLWVVWIALDINISSFHVIVFNWPQLIQLYRPWWECWIHEFIDRSDDSHNQSKWIYWTLIDSEMPKKYHFIAAFRSNIYLFLKKQFFSCHKLMIFLIFVWYTRWLQSWHRSKSVATMILEIEREIIRVY